MDKYAEGTINLKDEDKELLMEYVARAEILNPSNSPSNSPKKPIPNKINQQHDNIHENVAKTVQLIKDINEGLAANSEKIYNNVQKLVDAYNNIELTPEQNVNYEIMGNYLIQYIMRGGSIKNSKKRQSRTQKKRIIKQPKKTYKKNKHFSQHKTRKTNK